MPKEAVLPDKAIDRFIKSIGKANREEDVIAAYQRLFPGDWQRPFATDGYEHDALWEFKHGVNMHTGLPKVVAQGCYYLRKCYAAGVYKGQHFPLPSKLVVADDNEAVVIATSDLIKFVSDQSFDWDLPPSSPDPILVEALTHGFPPTRVYQVDDPDQLGHFVTALQNTGTHMLSEVTRHNFVSLFTVWKNMFPEGTDPQTLAYAYLIDLAKENALLDEVNGRIVFITEKGKIELPVSGERYTAFWNTYKRPPQYGEMQALYDRKDQLVAIQKRRMTGEFFTPLDIAEKGHEYLQAASPGGATALYKKVWWDCACGTGNLTFHCPDTTPLYMSTLEAGDLEVIRQSGQNPQATMFQFDFLNDPWEKLPKGMIDRIKEDGELVVMINPPFVAASGSTKSANKQGTSPTKTATGKAMTGYSHATKNFYTQFMFRLLDFSKTFGVKITLGMFSKAIFAGGPGYAAFRELWASHATYVNGFGFHAEEFQGTKGSWPCVWHQWRIEP